MGARWTAAAALGSVAALTAAPVAPAAGGTPTPEDVAKRLVRAYDRKDRGAICRLLSPDFAKVLGRWSCRQALPRLTDYPRQPYGIDDIAIVRSSRAVVTGNLAGVRMTLRFRIRRDDGKVVPWVRPERLWLVHKPGGWRVQKAGMVARVAARMGDDFPSDLLDPPATDRAALDRPASGLAPATVPCAGRAVTYHDPAGDTRAISRGELANAIFPAGRLARSWTDLRALTVQMDADTRRPCLTLRFAAPLRPLTRISVGWFSPFGGGSDLQYGDRVEIRLGADGVVRRSLNVVNRLDDPEFHPEIAERFPDVAQNPDGSLQVRLNSTQRTQELFRVAVRVQSVRANDLIAREKVDTADETHSALQRGIEWPSGRTGSLVR